MTNPEERERQRYRAQKSARQWSKLQSLWTWLIRIEIWVMIAFFVAALITALFS
jgi:hypothetical protein